MSFSVAQLRKMFLSSRQIPQRQVKSKSFVNLSVLRFVQETNLQHFKLFITQISRLTSDLQSTLIAMAEQENGCRYCKENKDRSNPASAHYCSHRPIMGGEYVYVFMMVALFIGSTTITYYVVCSAMSSLMKICGILSAGLLYDPIYLVCKELKYYPTCCKARAVILLLAVFLAVVLKHKTQTKLPIPE